MTTIQLFKHVIMLQEHRYEEALQKFLNAQTMLGYRPHLSYSVALCYYKLKDFTLALKHIGIAT